MSAPESVFRYRPLPNPVDYIRLVTLVPALDADAPLECQLRDVSRADNVPYFALSYACGDARDTYPVTVEGLAVGVYQNLEIALRHLRELPLAEGTSFWVDALCINQADDSEKSVQVRLMSNVYKSAASVLIWFEPRPDDGQIMCSVLEHMGADKFQDDWDELEDEWPQLDNSQKEHRIQAMRRDLYATQEATVQTPFLQSGPRKLSAKYNVEQPSLETIIGTHGIKGIASIFTQPWWSRLWIHQEFLLAKEATFVCGSRCFGARAIVRALYLVRRSSDGPDAILKAIGSGSEARQVNLNVLSIAVKRHHLFRDREKNAHASLINLMHDYRFPECSDPRDKVYALLGLATDETGRRTKPDYSLTPIQVLQTFVQNSLECDKRLDVFMLCGSYYSSFPSWVPDLTQSFLNPLVDGRREQGPIYSAAGDTVPQFVRRSGFEDREVILLGGYSLDIIYHIEESQGWTDLPSPERFKEWREIAGQHDQTTLEDFYRTFTGDQEGRSSKRMEPTDHESFEKRLHQYIKDIADDPTKVLTEDDEHWARLFSAGIGRRFFVTQIQNFIGLAQDTARVGDVVCILFGGQVPFVLRPVDNGEYVFKGDCFVKGIMDGETVADYTAGRYKTKQFTIR